MESEEKVVSLSEESKSQNSALSETASVKTERKFELSKTLREELRKYPEVLEFIDTLKKHIEKQKKKIKKLKSKHKKRKSVSTQTGEINEQPTHEARKTLSEEITEAAEIATKKSGFVYEETSGMYYDYNSGYYYNAEYGLYYDGNSGTYMTYNQETKTYDFYSQVEVTKNPDNNCATIESKPKLRKKRKVKPSESEQAPKRRAKPIDPLEDGECSDSTLEDVQSPICVSDEENIDISNGWPPCMRIIVQKSTVSTIKPGSLFIITYEGGSLGREGEHSILIPDINVSKHHLKFTFDSETKQFQVTDLGSRNGTILNGKRMATSKQESEALQVTHGSHIQIGSTVLLCHIHDGNRTCGHCEPGLLQQPDDTIKMYAITECNKNASYKKELNNLRKKFGVQHNDGKSGDLAPGYTDRALVRRSTVGSQNSNEKTQVASVNESIPSENKGFKMLAKMGWSKGQALGKDGKGLAEPIEVVANQGTSGIGCVNAVSCETKPSAVKQNIWMKTQERFKNLPPQTENKEFSLNDI